MNKTLSTSLLSRLTAPARKRRVDLQATYFKNGCIHVVAGIHDIDYTAQADIEGIDLQTDGTLSVGFTAKATHEKIVYTGEITGTFQPELRKEDPTLRAALADLQNASQKERVLWERHFAGGEMFPDESLADIVIGWWASLPNSAVAESEAAFTEDCLFAAGVHAAPPLDLAKLETLTKAVSGGVEVVRVPTLASDSVPPGYVPPPTPGDRPAWPEPSRN